MRIAHFAPFAPKRCGMYEAARDMIRADEQRGHDAYLVDTGVFRQDGTHETPIIGGVDERGGWRLLTMPPERAEVADILVMHTGAPDSWVVKTQAPMIWIMHGRPEAAYLLELHSKDASYGLYWHLARWPRTKALVYFWPEYELFWRAVLPPEKLIGLPWPPLDLARWRPEGPARALAVRGRWNGLICDSWREDVNTFAVTNGAIEAARRHPGLVWHFYGHEQGGPWHYLERALRELGALGEVLPRIELDDAYRAMDLVLSPQRAVSRIIAEALACGTPVIAAEHCRATRWTADVDDPGSVAQTVTALLQELAANRNGVRQECLATAQNFALQGSYGATMEQVYRAVGGMT